VTLMNLPKSIKDNAPRRLGQAIRRTEALNMRLKDILERGNITTASLSTIYRWANGTVDPRLSLYEAVMSAIESTIAAEEARLRIELTEERSQ